MARHATVTARGASDSGCRRINRTIHAIPMPSVPRAVIRNVRARCSCSLDRPHGIPAGGDGNPPFCGRMPAVKGGPLARLFVAAALALTGSAPAWAEGPQRTLTNTLAVQVNPIGLNDTITAQWLWRLSDSHEPVPRRRPLRGRRLQPLLARLRPARAVGRAVAPVRARPAGRCRAAGLLRHLRAHRRLPQLRRGLRPGGPRSGQGPGRLRHRRPVPLHAHLQDQARAVRRAHGGDVRVVARGCARPLLLRAVPGHAARRGRGRADGAVQPTPVRLPGHPAGRGSWPAPTTSVFDVYDAPQNRRQRVGPLAALDARGEALRRPRAHGDRRASTRYVEDPYRDGQIGGFLGLSFGFGS